MENKLVSGHIGFVVANSKNSLELNLTPRDLFLALAKYVPNDAGKLIDNPYKTWGEVNHDLPDYKIEVLGPTPDSAEFNAFVRLVIEVGCKTFDSIAALNDEDMSEAVCHRVRDDGAYIESGENYELIVQKLEANPEALSIFSFGFLDDDQSARERVLKFFASVQSVKIDGIAPTFETISDVSYTAARTVISNSPIDQVPAEIAYLFQPLGDNTASPLPDVDTTPTFMELPRIWGLCVDENTVVKMYDGGKKIITDVTGGESLLNNLGEEVVVLYLVTGPEKENMHEVSTELGKTVKVTTGHAFLSKEGIFLKASELLVGIELATLDGYERVTSIQLVEPSKLVYNVVISSREVFDNADRSKSINIEGKIMPWWEFLMRNDPFLGLKSKQQTFYTDGIVSGSGVIQGSINH